MSKRKNICGEDLTENLRRLNMERKKVFKEYQSEERYAELGVNYPLKILIADDQLINQKLMASLLNKLGFDSVVANNGREAVECFRNEKFDLIFMDIEMPVMNGIEAIEAILSSTPKDQLPYIVVYTTKFTEEDVKKYTALEVDCIIHKPANLEKVFTTLSTAIKKNYQINEI